LKKKAHAKGRRVSPGEGRRGSVRAESAEEGERCVEGTVHRQVAKSERQGKGSGIGREGGEKMSRGCRGFFGIVAKASDVRKGVSPGKGWTTSVWFAIGSIREEGEYELRGGGGERVSRNRASGRRPLSILFGRKIGFLYSVAVVEGVGRGPEDEVESPFWFYHRFSGMSLTESKCFASCPGGDTRRVGVNSV